MRATTLFDAGRLELLTGGDGALRSELQELFVREATRHVANATAAAAADDVASLARIAHVLGGAATNVGAMRLGTLANRVEDRAKAGELPHDLMSEIDRVFGETKAELERLRDVGRGVAASLSR